MISGKKYLMIIIASFILGVVLTYLFMSKGESHHIKISHGGSSVELKNSNTKKSLFENIDNLFSEETIANVVIDYIARNKEIYKFTDVRLIKSLIKICPMKYESLTSCIEKNEIVKALRKKADKRENPFQYEHIKVKVSIPRNEPERGTFFACKNSRFSDAKVLIYNKNDHNKNVEVSHRGHFSCPREQNNIHLNKKDREKIFGESSSKYEDGYAVKLD